MKAQTKRITAAVLALLFAFGLLYGISWHANAADNETYKISWATKTGDYGVIENITSDDSILAALNKLDVLAENEEWFYTSSASLNMISPIKASDTVSNVPSNAITYQDNENVIYVGAFEISYSIVWSDRDVNGGTESTDFTGNENLLDVMKTIHPLDDGWAWFYDEYGNVPVGASDTVSSHASYGGGTLTSSPYYVVFINSFPLSSESDTGSGDTGSGEEPGDTGSGSDTGSGDSGSESGDTGSDTGSSGFEPADFSKLEELIEKAEALNSEDYTEETWAALESALANAKALVQQDNVSASEISAAESALQSAMDSLVKVSTPDTDTGSHVDKSELESAEKESGDLHKSDYTEESWKDYEEALAAVEAVLNDPNATQEEIDAAYAALNKAVANLEEADDDEDVAAVSSTDSGSSSGSDEGSTLSTVGTPKTGVSNGMMYALTGMSAAAIAFLVLMLQERKAIVGRKYSGRRVK